MSVTIRQYSLIGGQTQAAALRAPRASSMEADSAIDAVIKAFSPEAEVESGTVNDDALSAKTTEWMMHAVTQALDEETLPTDEQILLRSTGRRVDGAASESEEVSASGAETPTLLPGGNTAKIGSAEWLAYGEAYGVWFPYPQGAIESMIGDIEAGTDGSFGFSHALQEFEDVLDAAGIEYEGAPISSRIDVLNQAEPTTPLAASIQALIQETSAQIESSGLKDADASARWREALAEAKRLIVASLPGETELPTEVASLLGQDAMSEAAWVAHGDYGRRSEYASRAFALTFQQGYLAATQFMNRAATTASAEQLTALAEEAMKKRRLDYRVTDSGSGDDVDEEAATKETEGYEGHSDAVARDLMAERLFWVHLRMGDKDWSFGNVMDQMLSMSSDGGADTREGTRQLWGGMSMPVTMSGRIDIANKIIEDERASVNLEAMNYAQIEGMRELASQLGVDVYDSKAKLTEDVSDALTEFRDDHRAELLRLARVDPEAFDKLTKAMVLIVQAAVEGRTELDAAMAEYERKVGGDDAH